MACSHTAKAVPFEILLSHDKLLAFLCRGISRLLSVCTFLLCLQAAGTAMLFP